MADYELDIRVDFLDEVHIDRIHIGGTKLSMVKSATAMSGSATIVYRGNSLYLFVWALQE